MLSMMLSVLDSAAEKVGLGFVKYQYGSLLHEAI